MSAARKPRGARPRDPEPQEATCRRCGVASLDVVIMPPRAPWLYYCGRCFDTIWPGWKDA